ncbi:MULTISPECIES: polyprenyl synthetase family protein [Rhodococcus]|uniref:Polyprenyl synthetase family protein n=1 Tax=Rhodococcus qingshengii JCM 15477 TaxID=1303681 RepID=A0AB38R5Y7_RHOSG|nr:MULTISPECIES: polyprenyl synthetase family protein [Rhodococcus]EEN88434.1 polyprenyl synthetase [Rhodococcus erythropolis SK121]MBP2523452.1 geranylgeranyl diphosphate synthase type I [Rhodococcus sp. PvP104]MDA3636633.1 polyprenyl synthetase family protein [Rhodococcus sp. C-2]UDF18947.1 polyprenyl synthetase family protein [Rhodococcus qingshengii]UPU40742.1 polyprenyl synthetase family protein [Rhodococcus qingshengii JCM 15477]
MEATLSAGTARVGQSSTNTAPHPTSLELPGLFEAALRDFFDSRRELVSNIGGGYEEAVSTLEAFVLRGGKRVRPSFAWTGWLGAGGDPNGKNADAVIRACAALELVQACALVHDDIIDASTTRRGFPTVHVEFENQHRDEEWSGDSAHFGEAVAILLGDLALAWADDMIRESGISPEAAARVSPVWSAMRTEVLGGQFLDISNEARGDETVEAAMRVNRYKTAAYTIERPLHLGAALFGADAELVDAYRTFGTDIGIAFQLRDDLLGVFGDPSVTGKPSGDDLIAGKRTVLFAMALARADAADPAAAELLRNGIGTQLTDTEVDTLRQVITDLGAVTDVETQIDTLVEAAANALDSSTATAESKARLTDMAIAATKRSY